MIFKHSLAFINPQRCSASQEPTTEGNAQVSICVCQVSVPSEPWMAVKVSTPWSVVQQNSKEMGSIHVRWPVRSHDTYDCLFSKTEAHQEECFLNQSPVSVLTSEGR